MYRPRVDYIAENDQLSDGELEPDEMDDKFVEETNETVMGDIMFEPAKDHPEWKWTVLWEGFKIFTDYKRRAKYCDPDNFGMYIYNDFCGKGLMELMENMVRMNLMNLNFVLICQDTCLRCCAQEERRRRAQADVGAHQCARALAQ